MSASDIGEFERTRAMNEQKLLEQPLRECFAVKKLHGHPYFLTFIDVCYAQDYGTASLSVGPLYIPVRY